MCAGGGCETAVIVRTRCRLVELRECGDLLSDRRFYEKLKRAVYESYVRPEILYENDACSLRKARLEIYEGQNDS